MIEVKIDVKLTSARQLLNTDPEDIFDKLADVFFDNESVLERDMAADYSLIKIDMNMWLQSDSVEQAIEIAVRAVKKAIEVAHQQLPWVKAEIGSVTAGHLAAA